MNVELLLAVLIGCVINLLFGLNEGLVKPDFKWLLFLKYNIVPTILNLMCGAVIVWFRNDLTAIFPLGGLSAVFLGLSGQTIFKKLQNMMDKKVDTYIGTNS